MSEDIKKFKELIKGAKNILVTTHNGPDPDAWTSLSIATLALDRYLDRKDVKVVVTGTNRHSKLTKEYEAINGMSLSSPEDEVDLRGIDLIIMTDAHELGRCFPKYTNLQSNVKIVGIDHHELNPEAVEILALNFNKYRSSAAEEVYRVLRDLIGLAFSEDKEIAILAQKGIIADTGRFMYSSTSSETYKLMSELVNIERLDVEKYMKELNELTVGAIEALKIYLENFVKEGDMAYMAIDAKDVLERGIEIEDRDKAGMFLSNDIIKNIEGVDWGFILRESLNEAGKWSVSFRAENGTREVVHIAKLLNGGGHKYAAGGKFHATSKEEAIKIVLDAAKETESIKG